MRTHTSDNITHLLRYQYRLRPPRCPPWPCSATPPEAAGARFSQLPTRRQAPVPLATGESPPPAPSPVLATVVVVTKVAHAWICHMRYAVLYPESRTEGVDKTMVLLDRRHSVKRQAKGENDRFGAADSTPCHQDLFGGAGYWQATYTPSTCQHGLAIAVGGKRLLSAQRDHRHMRPFILTKPSCGSVSVFSSTYNKPLS